MHAAQAEQEEIKLRREKRWLLDPGEAANPLFEILFICLIFLVRVVQNQKQMVLTIDKQS